MRQARYIDPTTDYGFKRIFGTEANKDLLKSFLNELFRGRKEIKELYYNKNEHVGDAGDIGTVIFDLTCTGSNGEQFVIEVQRSSQVNLKRRMLYYGSKLIADQAPKGNRKEWNYAISEVYVIVLMDGFPMPGRGVNKGFLHDICLCNRENGEVFYEDLGFIYLELINFTKGETYLSNDLDRWLHVLKNMSTMDKLPVYLRKPIFEKLFQIAEYSKLNKEEREMYDVSLKRKWDAEAIRQYQEQQLEEAIRRGMEEGMEKGMEKGMEEGAEKERAKAEAEKRDSAVKMLKNGFDVKLISDILGLSIEEIEKLK